MNVVAQQNADDCGVHAIAYATELAHGTDPVLCSWDFENMRPHLIQCLESGVIARFPKLGEENQIWNSSTQIQNCQHPMQLQDCE